jgi:hypothetical protein
LELLCSVQHRGWKYIVTSDKGWVHLSNHYEQIELPDSGYLTTIEREMINNPKTIVSEISLETLIATFHQWMEMLQRCIDGGEYVE